MKTKILKPILYLFAIAQIVSIIIYFFSPRAENMTLTLAMLPAIIFFVVFILAIIMALIHIKYMQWDFKRDARKYGK